jgi:AraC family transcriptional regulator
MIRLGELDRLLVTSSIDFRVRRVLEYTRSNLRHDLSLRILAMIANVSVWHVCRLFKKEVGLSPGRCVKLLRLQYAAELLATTSMSVKEVMVAVGMNDESHFVRDFRQSVGDFPVLYRKRVHTLLTMMPNSLDAKKR